MVGIPISGPTVVLCDNQGVVSNTSLPPSSLKKNHNAIAYHRGREAAAAGVFQVQHINGRDNVADILAKATDGPTFRQHLKAVLDLL